MTDIFLSIVFHLFLYWQIRNKSFTVCQHVSSTYITVDTLSVSVSPGCLQEPKLARTIVVAGRSHLLIMGWGQTWQGELSPILS